MKTINLFRKNKRQTTKMLMKLPIVFDWCQYKGEDVVAQINFEKSMIVGRPMMDLSYCMTKAMNQNILKTVQWDKNKFKKSKLSSGWMDSHEHI